MNNLSTELIKVSGVSQYSVYVGDKRYSFGRGVDSTKFVKGNTYSVTIYTGEKGGKYINKIDADLGVLNIDGPMPSAPLNADVNKAETPKVFAADTRPRRAKQGEPLTQYDLDTQERISRAGVIQAAVQAVSTHSSSVEELILNAQRVAQEMLTWVNQHQETTSPLTQSVSVQQ